MVWASMPKLHARPASRTNVNRRFYGFFMDFMAFYGFLWPEYGGFLWIFDSSHLIALEHWIFVIQSRLQMVFDDDRPSQVTHDQHRSGPKISEARLKRKKYEEMRSSLPKSSVPYCLQMILLVLVIYWDFMLDLSRLAASAGMSSHFFLAGPLNHGKDKRL